MKLSWIVRGLPEPCAMRDGRKWRSIPFIIFRSIFDHDLAADAQEYTHAKLVFVPRSQPDIMLRVIHELVDEYQDRVLADYVSCGILVRFENGHAQISPALQRRSRNIESEYYYSPADRRTHSGWLTIKRDKQGLSHDVEMFRMLLETNANESMMHKFFEEHPNFLMETRKGIPISHRPRFTEPKGWTPDFTILPIVNPLEGEIELLELKGPGEKSITRGPHPGFSSKVKRAVDQVKDYDLCLRNPLNHRGILKDIGLIPERSKLAVLIGRDPITELGMKTRAQRQSEIDVQVVSYDEILATQENQL